MSTKNYVISSITCTFATDGAAGLVGSWVVSTTIGCVCVCVGVECMCVCVECMVCVCVECMVCVRVWRC